jgi:hypothetical protein
MNTRTQIVIASLLIVLVLFASACGAPAATPAPVAVREAVVVKAAPTQPPAPTTAPAAAPAPTQAALAKPGAVSQSGVSDVGASPYRTSQMIIKNGEMNLLVADVDVALDRATAIAVELGGYLLNGKSWMQDGWKYSSLTVGVPVDQFETAQRRMRALAVQVLNDTASGQDVSTEFVDVQSRVVNLEATAARIREFLKQAKDVNEALQVNAKLAEVEAEIEQAKGRMNYLKDRAAYSTLTISLEPQRPTPTPTLTPTVTPTPTATPTPTPNVWRPDRTFNAASEVLTGLMRVIGDVVIWFCVVVAPFALPVVIIWTLWRRAQQKKVKRVALPDESTPEQPEETTLAAH